MTVKFHGPVDYNIDTVRKRLKVFKALNLSVINYYSRQGKLHMVILLHYNILKLDVTTSKFVKRNLTGL